MKTYMPTYRDKKTGKKKKCSHYYLTFVDNRQIRRRLPAYANKRETDNLGIRIQQLLDSGGVLNRDLQEWLEGLKPKIQEKLVGFGLIDNQRLSANLGKPLLEHLKDFCEGLAADKRKESYIKQTEANIHRILRNCRFKVWSDIDGNKVKTFLAKSRGPNGYGERTYNAYLRAFKEFCSWLLREDRVAGSDPMKNHPLIKQTEFRKRRRALTLDEMHRLLEATEASQKRFNMGGYERSLVYRLALQTGTRAGEIKRLRKLSFDFDASPCTVHVEASDTKGKRPADLILMDETAATIKEFLTDKKPQDTVFAMPHSANTANMLKEDLAEAEIEYTDASGRDCDFHSLRHTFITNLALAGVHPTVAQKLARHSSIELTMKYYTHVLHNSEVDAIDALHDLSYTCQKDTQRRTTVDCSGQRNDDNNIKTRLSA